MYPYDPHGRGTPSPPPPQPIVDPRPLSPTLPPNAGEDNTGGKAKDGGGRGKSNNGEPFSKDPNPLSPPSDSSSQDPVPGNDRPKKKPAARGGSSSSTGSSTSTTSSSSFSPDTMSYEKVEVVESVEKFSNDRKVKGYEETSMVVETMIEKLSKKKH